MKPILNALLIADNVYCDKETNKKVIAGTFNQLAIRRPSERVPESVEPAGGRKKTAGPDAGSPTLYINLAEVRGCVPLTLRFVDLLDNSVSFEGEFTIQNEDPLQNSELIVRLPRLPCRRAGVHALELLTEGEPIGSLRILVREDTGASGDEAEGGGRE
ncbi:MAG TPA: hypothetical protein PLF81_10615 [Candidatus Anammoximicrobium sp.]|nr:hypothetical protein [Candidatus Anammoximicrobium sp.]